jgi:all-trans-retinol 13,14-reductase
MHILGGMNPSGNAYKVCQYLGILDKVCHQEVDAQVVDSIYFASDKTYYHTAKGKENFVAALAAQFPHQKDNLTAYVEALYRIVGEFDLFYLRSTKEGAFLPTYSN